MTPLNHRAALLRAAAFGLATFGLIAGAGAESMNMQHKHEMPGTTPGLPPSASSQAFMAVNHQMHQAMPRTMTGDADVDFVRSMIPHHQGAVDMAKVELQYGKDPELRKLAEDIVAAQEREIVFMQSWLEKHVK